MFFKYVTSHCNISVIRRLRNLRSSANITHLLSPLPNLTTTQDICDKTPNVSDFVHSYNVHETDTDFGYRNDSQTRLYIEKAYKHNLICYLITVKINNPYMSEYISNDLMLPRIYEIQFNQISDSVTSYIIFTVACGILCLWKALILAQSNNSY